MSPWQVLFGLALAAYAVWVYWLLVTRVRDGRMWWSMAAAWLSSPVLIVFIRVVLEPDMLAATYNPRTQSWAALFGDVIFLPLAAGLGALSWRKLRKVPAWATSWWWTVLCAGLGLSAGAWFHYNEIAVYRQAGAGLALNSPSKWAHDFVSYPTLFGGLLCVLAPPLFSRLATKAARKTALLSFAMLLVWASLVAADAQRTPPLNPRDLHPGWSVVKFSTTPYPPV